MDNSSVPSTPLFPPIHDGCCPPNPPPNYGCPVPGCPVPGKPFPPPHPKPCQPPYPDPHDPDYWAKDGDWPLPPNDCAPQRRPAKDCCDEKSSVTVVPPPIPPVRYVPGMDVQEQLRHMANHVNVCVDRWNQIQANCYAALDKVVGAAVSNDVYYEPDEVRFSTGYSSADGSTYEIIECKPVDKAGRPIRLQLQTAFNSGNPAVRQSITDRSFVSSGNAVITAVSPAVEWRGLCMVHGNPVSTNEPQEGDWLCGWTKRGVLRLLPATETTVESACRNQIVDCIGPVIPIVMNGKPTQVAADYPAEPGAIQAIGWKQCNGNKVLFSCGFQDEPGCTVKNVADLLVSMGVTTAAVTCYMNAYGSGNMGPFVKTDVKSQPLSNKATVINVVGQAENVRDNVGVVPEPWVDQYDKLSSTASLGLTGGMTYIGKLADRPLQFQVPQNSAFWVVTKRPTKAGWPNRWTGEIADICQRLGMNATELESVQGKIDIEQIQILDLQNRVGKLEENDKTQDDAIRDHETRISDVEERLTTAEGNITKLFDDLADETAARIAGDEELAERLAAETDARIDGDNKLNDRVNQLRTALTEEITARNQADQDLSNAILNEVNARIAGDTALSTKIDMTQMNLENKLAKETADRTAADDNLQEQIDALGKDVSKINLKTGAGLRETVSSTGERKIEVYAGPGLRFNQVGQVTPNIGPGLQIVDGRLIPKVSDCFTINEEGELTMACCENSKLPIAGVGVDYGVDAQTGDVILNVTPPKDGDIGGVKAGSGVTIAPDGTISANGGGGGEAYTLPPATKTTLGGVIVGDNITVDDNGKISASSDYVLPVASPTVLGGVKVGKNLNIDQNGVLNADIPDAPAGTGDIVLAGDGINVVKDSSVATATVSLSDETQGTLAQVGDNKNAIDALDAKVDNVQKSTVSNTLFQTTIQGINQNVTKLQGDVNAAQTTADQANAAATEAANIANEAKETADNATAAFVNALPLSGGTMTGDISFASSASRSVGGKPTVKGLPMPTEPDEVANKEYVDQAVSGADTSGLMPKSGGTFTGTVTMGSGAKLNGIATPEGESEAANKGYVDGLKPDIAAAQTTADAASSKADAAASSAATASQTATQALTKANEAKNSADTATETADAALTAANEAKTAVEGGPFLPVSGGTVNGDVTVDRKSINNGPQLNLHRSASSRTGGLAISYNTGAYVDAVTISKGDDNYTVLIDSTTSAQGIAEEKNIKLRGVATPTKNNDAANKKYVDDAVAGVSGGGSSGSYLPLTGGTISGSLKVGSSPTSNTTIANGYIGISRSTSARSNEPSVLSLVQQSIIAGTTVDTIKLSYEQSVNVTSGDVIVRGIKNPVQSYDAANKAYVDSAVAGAGSVDTTSFVRKTGDTMTGALTLNGNPTSDRHAATKKYVDDAVANASSGGSYLPLSGGTLTGALTLKNCGTIGNGLKLVGDSNNNVIMYVSSRSELRINTTDSSPVTISNIKTPTRTDEVANKSYVDNVATNTQIVRTSFSVVLLNDFGDLSNVKLIIYSRKLGSNIIGLSLDNVSNFFRISSSIQNTTNNVNLGRVAIDSIRQTLPNFTGIIKPKKMYGTLLENDSQAVGVVIASSVLEGSNEFLQFTLALNKNLTWSSYPYSIYPCMVGY